MHNSFDRDELQAPLAEINMTPLVDVMLVLVVIFLVTAPMITNSINLNLPSDTASTMKQEKAIAISIDKRGLYYIDEVQISARELKNKLKEIAIVNSKKQIHLRADKDVAYSKVSYVLGQAQKNGLNNIGFITTPND